MALQTRPMAPHRPGAVPADVGAARAAQRRRRRRVTIGLTIVLLTLATSAMCLGASAISPGEVFASLLGPLTGRSDPGTDFIVLTLRLPRMLTAVLTGVAFGLAGTVFQTLVRNPLASPDIIGITSGASAAAVVAIIVLGWGGVLVSVSAFAGALLAALAVYVLAWRRGMSPYRMVLVGIGLAALLDAVVSFLFAKAEVTDVRRALVWITGSLNGSTMAALWPLVGSLVVLVPLLAISLRGLQGLQLGDDTAKAIGVRTEPVRLLILVVGVALAAVATSTAGPVAFVAFVAGPIARRLLGPAGSGFLQAAMVGACVMIGSDLIAARLFPSAQLPVGVITGALGAPFLIWLLIATNRSGRAA